MKTSNKLLLGFFCLIIASFVTFNIVIKLRIAKLPTRNEVLKSNSGITNNSLLIDSTEVILSMDNASSIVDISNYQAKLKKVNIDLKIDRIEYDSVNRIKLLSISVNCNDGFKGSTKKTLSGGEKIGFYRMYGKDAKSPFAMYPMELKNPSPKDSLQTDSLIKKYSVGSKFKSEAGLLIHKQEIFLVINRNTTLAELDDYRNKLKARNIDLSVEKINFDADKKIKTIDISVDCNDGFLCSTKETLDNNNIVGFYRIYSKNAESPFGMIPILSTKNAFKK